MNHYVFNVPTVRSKHRSFNARLIPAKLQELALAGQYYESRLIN